MTTTRWLLLGFALGIALAAVPACGTGKAVCKPSNCNGCCDASGTCQPGSTNNACGNLGTLCSVCVTGQFCNLGLCANIGQGGGGGGGGAGGGGFTGGGAGGGSGGGATGGGTGGGATGGGTGGGATGGGGGTCAGCTQGATCIDPPNNGNDTSCGAGGNPCQNCLNFSQTCQGSSGVYFCVGGTGGGAGGGTGGGAGGGVGGGVGGGGGTTAAIGSPCTNSTQCTGLGSGAFCKTATTRGTPYPGGWCTLPCTGAGTCGTTGYCIGGAQSVLQFYGEGQQLCAPTCTTPGGQSNCAAGYSCYGGTGGNFCWLTPIPDFDGGPSPNKLGNACTTTNDCINPPSSDLGFCYPGTFDGGATGYTGGYCFADCTYDNTGGFCGANGVCLEIDQQTGEAWCFGRCSNPGAGRCPRTTQNCYTLNDGSGGTLPYGVCDLACDQPGSYDCSAYGTGYTCQTTGANAGYCCDTGGNCVN